MSDDRLLDKIKKCLALASSSNRHEAEIAWRQARKLMEANKLDMQDIHASLACAVNCPVGRRPPVWLLSLAQACAEAFNCQVITQSSIHGSQVVFIGTQNSPEFAEYAFMALQSQLLIARKLYVASLTRCRLSTKRRRGEIFAENWVSGVHGNVMRFAERDETTTKTIEAYISKNFTSLTTRELDSKKVTGRDYSAARAGYHAGRNTPLHRPVAVDKVPIITLEV